MKGKTLVLLSSGEYSDYRVVDLLWVPKELDVTELTRVASELHCSADEEADNWSELAAPLTEKIKDRLGLSVKFDNDYITRADAVKAVLFASGAKQADFAETWIE